MVRRTIKRSVVVIPITLLMSILAGVAPAGAAFPGENGRIVFDTVATFWSGEGPSQIYSVRPNGDAVRQLTDVAAGSGAWHPAVSPNGGRIVFVVSREGSNDQVWIMRSDGTHERLLTDEPAWSDSGPSFSADGRRVLYSRCGNYVAFYWTCRIVSVDLDGSDRQTVVGGTWHPSDPVMAPDGSTVAYVSDRGGYDARIWLMNVATGRHLTIGPTFGVERLSWAPDGSHLTFTGNFRSGSVFTIAVDGTDLEKIVPGSLFPAWSPDGTRIISKVEGPTFGGPLRKTWTDGTHPTVIVGTGDVTGVGFSDWGVAR